MNDLIAQARERCNNTAAWPWHSELSLIWKLADALEKVEDEIARIKETHEALENDLINANMNLEHIEAELATYKEANPPRVHGEWVVDECDTTDDVPSSAWINFHCSVCNMDYGLDEGQYGWCRDEEIPYHFCPNCGADMRKEKP